MEEDENLFELNDADELYGDDPLGRKTFAFSIRIVRMFKYLRKNHNEYDLSRQVLRSGTGIGSNLQEGGSAQSRPDFISKFHISLKEASETRY